MKRNIARTMLMIISVVTLCMGLASAAQAADHCSNAKAAGNWGLTLTGTLILPTGPVPGAAVARARNRCGREHLWHGGQKCGRRLRHRDNQRILDGEF